MPAALEYVTVMVPDTRENAWMDFAMRYDRWYRPLATLLAVGPMWTKIQVLEGILHIKHGWMFRMDVSLTDIKAARLVTERPWAWGVHRAKDGWLVNGSRRGIVKVKFTHPSEPKKAPLGSMNWLGADWSGAAPRAVYISVTEPDAFIAALTSQSKPDSAPPHSFETTANIAAPADAMTITGWLAAVAVSGAAAMLLFTIIDGYVLAVHHQLPPNATFGFRDATTRSCLPAWYAAQKAGFNWLLFGAGPLLAFNMLFCVAAVIKRRSPWDVVAMAMGTLLLVLVVVVIAGIHADSIARTITG